MRARLIMLAFLAVILIVFIAKLILIVDAGEIAVIFNQVNGGLTQKYPGTNFLIPGVQKAITYDTRVQTYTMAATYAEGEKKGDDAIETLTKDGQMVTMDLSVRFHIDQTRVTNLHREIGPDYINKIVRPEIRNQIRLAVSGYPVTEVYTEKRSEIQNQTQENLKRKFSLSYLILDEVLIRNIRFSPEFEKAIEQKQIAQQEAQRMQYVLDKERQEKERKIIEAQGEAESIRLKAQVLAQNPALIQYEYVQKLAPGVKTIITDGKSIMSLGDITKQ
jgi:prohibitin 2